jgi:hypothetical protein
MAACCLPRSCRRHTDQRTRGALDDAHDQLANGWTPDEVAAGLVAHLADRASLPLAEATPLSIWDGGPR